MQYLKLQCMVRICQYKALNAQCGNRPVAFHKCHESSCPYVCIFPKFQRLSFSSHVNGNVFVQKCLKVAKSRAYLVPYKHCKVDMFWAKIPAPLRLAACVCHANKFKNLAEALKHIGCSGNL